MKGSNVLLSVLLASLASIVWAGSLGSIKGAHDVSEMSGMSNGAPGRVTQNTPLSEGVIRKVDAAAGKVTIRHGELANLGMPPMTMTFGSNRSMLKNYRVGDKVQFRAERSDEGALVVTRMSHMN